MSRNIDWGKALTEEDRGWLLGNGRHSEVEYHERFLAGLTTHEDEQVVAPVDPEHGAISPDAQPASKAAQQASEEQAAEAAAAALNVGSTADTVGQATEPAAVGDNYDDEAAWSHAELKSEVKERAEDGAFLDVPPLNSNRATFIAWLRMDDLR
jgi:hypothetical protein